MLRNNPLSQNNDKKQIKCTGKIDLAVNYMWV